jgi:hypothetical protein
VKLDTGIPAPDQTLKGLQHHLLDATSGCHCPGQPERGSNFALIRSENSPTPNRKILRSTEMDHRGPVVASAVLPKPTLQRPRSDFSIGSITHCGNSHARKRDAAHKGVGLETWGGFCSKNSRSTVSASSRAAPAVRRMTLSLLR